MKLKECLFAVAITLGFAACSSKDDKVEVTPPSAKNKTYVNITIALPGANNSRALPEDYNPDGTYEGNDLIKTLDLYLVGDDGTTEARRFDQTEIAISNNLITPSEPFMTSPGVKTAYVFLNSNEPLASTAPSPNDLIAISGLAQVENGQDVIMMSGQSTATTILPDIFKEDVVAGQNRIALNVTRIASRVIVTTTASNSLMDNEGNTIGTISDLTYSVAQGTNQVYRCAQDNYVTYGSAWIPTTVDSYTSTANQYYDYSDLSNSTSIPAKPAGDGYKSLVGKFLFENTHTTGDRSTSGYKKGNTAYILVRATVTPDASVIADGGTLVNGTFYIGSSDGRIYSSIAAAQTAVANQRVTAYPRGKALYYAWLNPDVIAEPLNSPVVRNNIYHINVNSFNNVGLNWNPLYPENPDTPNPTNPDPKPVNPSEPENPVDPTDPLTTEDTYMSVDVTVLDWTVHSYDVDF